MTEPDWISEARRLATNFAARAERHDREGSFPHENFDELVEAGFARLTVPREKGGFEVPISTFVRVQEELAAGDGSTALAFNMHLVRFGGGRETPVFAQHWWDEMCRGAVEDGWLANTVATEEGLGSPSHGGLPATTATPVEGGWLINGHKTFTTMAPRLKYFIVLAAATDPETGTVAPGNFMLFRDDPGMRVVETWDALGMRATGSHDVVFDNVVIPRDRLMNRSGPSVRGAAGSAWFALGVAATTLGVARAARDYAVNFARERTPVGRPVIKTFPGVRTRVARMDILLHRSRVLIHDAATAWEARSTDGLAPSSRVAIAKVEALNNCIEAVDLAMRVVGGVSLQKTRPIERYYRDVRAGLHNPPIEDIALETLAKAALDD